MQQPTEEEVNRLKVELAGGDGDGIKLSDAAETGIGAVDPEGVQGHQLADAEKG
jgi:hypothetical protein